MRFSIESKIFCGVRRSVVRASRVAGGAMLIMLAACGTTPSNERVTGSGGTGLRYSSRQVTVDLTDSERHTLATLRDRAYPDTTPERAIKAVAAVLGADGYAPVTTETDTGLVQAGRSEVLVPTWREVLRGVLKTKLGMLPAKPDHQYTAALISVRAAADGQGALVRARFDNTVWDSNGDSKTQTVVDRTAYDAFFTRLAEALRPGGMPVPPAASPHQPQAQ